MSFSRGNGASLIFVLVAVCLLRTVSAVSQHNVVLLLGFDGFRYDYLGRGLTPVLEKFANGGVKTDYMQNVFPTKTFTNFFTIGTGLYAETHGVLANNAFNEDAKCLSYGEELFHYNPNVTPIWTLNEITGDGRHSGCMMWPGCDYPYQNVTLTFLQVFNQSIPWVDRVDAVLGWITHSETPINLLNMYFEQPDGISHDYGPNSPQTDDQLKHVNTILEYIFAKLDEALLLEKVNVMVISDHGFADVNVNEYINVPSIVNNETYVQCGKSPALQIWPKPGYEEQIRENLTAAANSLKTFTVYTPDQVPEKWHYKNNRRNIGFLLLADMSYTFQDGIRSVGNHGYPPEVKEMRAFFAAKGPLFRERFHLSHVRNIDIYPLVAYLLALDYVSLNVKPNGTVVNMLSMLRSDGNEYRKFSPKFSGVASAIGIRVVLNSLDNR